MEWQNCCYIHHLLKLLFEHELSKYKPPKKFTVAWTMKLVNEHSCVVINLLNTVHLSYQHYNEYYM
jgi:hypothetical protein